jgi:hypothetical protein
LTIKKGEMERKEIFDRANEKLTGSEAARLSMSGSR